MKGAEALPERQIKNIIRRAKDAQRQIEQRSRQGVIMGTIIFRMPTTGVPGMIHETCL